MATIKIAYSSKRSLDLSACDSVTLCLISGWEANTASGSRLVYATVDNAGRKLSAYGFFNRFFNARGSALYQYYFLVDDAQFNINPESGLPYQITCADICEVFPYCCVSSEIIRGL